MSAFDDAKPAWGPKAAIGKLMPFLLLQAFNLGVYAIILVPIN
jgi:hypothetical protein